MSDSITFAAVIEAARELTQERDKLRKQLEIAKNENDVLRKHLEIALTAMENAAIEFEKLELPMCDEDEWQIANNAHNDISNDLVEIKKIKP